MRGSADGEASTKVLGLRNAVTGAGSGGSQGLVVSH